MPKSISARIAILFLLTVLLPMLILGTLLLKERYKTLQAQLVTKHQNNAENLAQGVAGYLEELVNDLKIVSNIISLQGGNDAHTFILLKSLQLHQSAFQELAIIDSKGQTLTVRSNDKESYAVNSDEYKEILNQLKIHLQPLVSIVPESANTPPVLSISCPIFFLDKSFVSSAVTTKASLAGLDKYIHHSYNIPQAKTGLFLPDGSLLGKDRLPLELNIVDLLKDNTKSAALILDDRVIGISPVNFESLELYVVVISDMKAKMAPFFQSLWIFLFILFLIFAAALLTGLFFVKQLLASPLNVLSSAARKFRDGNLETRVTLTGENEFGELADTFNSMAKAIQSQIMEIKQTSIELEKNREDLQQKQQQLLHAEKLSAIGRLSASIAHEFNNPLYGVMNVIRGLQKGATLQGDERELVGMALDECVRMKNLIMDLQDFNRPTSGKVGPMDLHNCINSLLTLYRKYFTLHNMTITKDYVQHMPQLYAVKDQIKQVLLNLLINATDACEHGGHIIITTETVKDDKICIRIQDTGKGIQPDDMGRIFEPFFTTKAGRKGTGLGLAVSYGIITNHGGTIQVESKLGAGTIFTIILPIKR